MSVKGLKKQFHKASQLLKEKINGVEGTELGEEFVKMKKKTDIIHKLIVDLVLKTTEYLQPNPAHRAKLGVLNKMSRIRGQVKAVGYPQTEGILGDCMLRHGVKLGEDNEFGCALVDMGQALKQMAQLRDSLDELVKRSFIDPLQKLQDKDLKEIAFHLKKLEGRRLDFDYKKRCKDKIRDSEIKQAKEKFEESKELAERSMFNLLQSDVEQVRHLLGLVEAAMDYHRQSSDILDNLRSDLQNRISDASTKPRRNCTSKSLTSTMCYTGTYGFSTSTSYETDITEAQSEKDKTPAADTLNQTVAPSQTGKSTTPNQKKFRHYGKCDCSSTLDQPCCRALYSFTPENDKELHFKKGDLIILTNQIDENWYEGLLRGQSGFFPISYVEVLIPLPASVN